MILQIYVFIIIQKMIQLQHHGQNIYLYVGDIIFNSQLETMKAKKLIYQRLDQVVATSDRFDQFEKQRIRKSITTNVVKNSWYDDCTLNKVI